MNEQHAAALRGADLRVTAPRLATLAAIEAEPHQSADMIATKVRDRLGTVSKQAIYDVLNALTEAQILRRLAVDGRVAQYEINNGDNHHHLVCRTCGRMEDVPCAKQEAPCMHPELEVDFDIEVADVIYRGQCARCRAQEFAKSNAVQHR